MENNRKKIPIMNIIFWNFTFKGSMQRIYTNTSSPLLKGAENNKKDVCYEYKMNNIENGANNFDYHTWSKDSLSKKVLLSLMLY